MKGKILLLILTGIALLILLFGATELLTPQVTADAGAISAANQLHEAGNYDDAIRIYEQLIAQGVQDSTVHYNLGNAYYQKGDIGRAVLNYQRASQLNPRDADVRANLELARSQAQSPFMDAAPGPVGILATMTDRWLTLDETAVLALALWFLAGILLLGWRILEPGKMRTFAQSGALIALLFLGFIGLSLGTRIYTERAMPEGVVVAPVVAVSSEPGEQFITDFSLHSGTEINLSETQGEWARLEVPGDAFEGWIPLKAVEPVAKWSPTHGTLL